MTFLLMLAELVGMACLVVCAYLIYPPAAWGIAGVLLILAANLSAARRGNNPKGDT